MELNNPTEGNNFYSFFEWGRYLELDSRGSLLRIPLDRVQAAVQAFPARILAGQSVCNVAGTATNDANAAAGQILSGYTAYVKGNKITGSIPSKGAATYTPSTVTQTIAAGQYLSGVQTINPIPSNYYNINANQTVFKDGSYGVIGSLGACIASSQNPWKSDGLAASTSNSRLTIPSVMVSGASAVIFRGSIPSNYKYIKITQGVSIYTGMQVHIINPGTRNAIWTSGNITWNGSVGVFNFSGVTLPANGYWLAIVNGTTSTHYVSEVLASTSGF